MLLHPFHLGVITGVRIIIEIVIAEALAPFQMLAVEKQSPAEPVWHLVVEKLKILVVNKVGVLAYRKKPDIAAANEGALL